MNHLAHSIEGVNISQIIRNYTFTFTGKEKDAETGFSYFGARYYDCDLNGSLRLNPQSEVLCGARLTSPQDLFILSVDPMSDKYPSISPYNYCMWNPVKLVDLDGNSPIRGIVSAVNVARKTYRIYKKTGKLNAATLKKAGIGELVDIAGDLTTIFSGDASVVDRIIAAADLIIGTDFNQQGNARVVKAVNKKAGDIKKRAKSQSRQSETSWSGKT